ncbi:hypothetical protein C0993_012138 [Termitomyces sp. T159_Od127]|nr:hypothetical protein C0993_012138 [Termitomyces sp. T159_Od127]
MSSDSWSPPTPTTRTPTTAPSARPSDLASGTLPVPGTGPAMTPHWTADWVSTMQQMQLTLAALERRLAALETGHVVTAARTADKRSNAPGHGLKQAHDLSSSRLAAFLVGPAGGEGRRFVTIRGTDQQIGEALVVLGKRITKKRVRAPQKQRSGNAAPAVAVPAPSRESALSTPKPSIQFAPPPPKASAQSALPPPPMASMHDSTTDFKEPADWDDPPPMPVLATSSLLAGSPMALSSPTPALSFPMVIDYAFGHYTPGISTVPPCGTNTARCSCPTWGR